MGGLEIELVPAEITYGLERLAMFLQGKSSALELEWAPGVTWGEVYKESEREWSIYNFEVAPVETLARRFEDHEAECRDLLDRELPLPAYDQVLKCSHTFNLLDARGAISVTERAAYIGRVRKLARRVAQLYVEKICRPALLRSAARSCCLGVRGSCDGASRAVASRLGAGRSSSGRDAWRSSSTSSPSASR